VFAVQDSAYRSLTAQTTTCLQGKASGRPETPSQRRPETMSLNCDNSWNYYLNRSEPKQNKEKKNNLVTLMEKNIRQESEEIISNEKENMN
jgi:hypothetical protein